MSNDKSTEEIVRGMELYSLDYLSYKLDSETAQAIKSAAALIESLTAQLAGAGANALIQAHIIEGQRNPLDADKIIKLTMENTTLRAQLSASQQRERAAVEDLAIANFCSQCRLFVAQRCDGRHKRGKCADWRWRGPQEVGK